jgi:photosystem II stability/assembly factor-like uncharacterized protein
LSAALAGSAEAGANLWTHNGPYGGSVTLLVVDSARPGTLYAVVDQDLYTTVDGGATWRSPDGPSCRSGTGGGCLIQSLAVVPGTAILYAGTSEGLFKSSDGGTTWPSGSSGPTCAAPGISVVPCAVASLVLDPVTSTTLYAATPQGVFKSTDGGATWREARTGLPCAGSCHLVTLAIDPRTPTTLHAATSPGLFRTVDGATTWQALILPGPVQSIVLDPITTTVLYAVTSRGLFKSADGGATWGPLDLACPGLPSVECEILALAIDPGTPTTLYAGTSRGGVFKSNDGGATWTAQNNGLTHARVSVLAIDPARPTTVYAGTSGGGVLTPSSSAADGPGGVFKTVDGAATWFPASAGLARVGIAAIAADPRTPGTVYAAGGSFLGGGVYKSTDAGTSWREVSAGLPTHWVTDVAVDPATPTTLYAAMAPIPFSNVVAQTVAKSTDGAETWRGISTGLPCPALPCSVQLLAIAPATPTTLYAVGSSGLFKTVDGGANWIPAGAGLVCPRRTGVGFCQIRTLVIDPVTPTTLYAGVAQDFFLSGFVSPGGVFRSLDAGASWSPLVTGPFSVTALVIDPAVPTTLYAGTGDVDSGEGVFKSVDGGRSWDARSAGLPRCADGGVCAVSALAIDSRAPTTVYAVTSSRDVFRSLDGAASWSPLLRGLDGSVSELVVDPLDPARVYAGGSGVFVIEQRLAFTSPPGGSRLPVAEPTSLTFAWPAVPGAERYGVEFTGPDRLFTNPNGSGPDAVNGCGGAGGCVVVTGTSLTVELGPSTPPGRYEVRVGALSARGEVIAHLGDTLAVVIGMEGVPTRPDRPTLSAPADGVTLARGDAVTVAWTAVAGAAGYLVEVSHPGGRFANPNGTEPDPSVLASLTVTATALSAVVPPELRPARYQVRVIGLTAAGRPIGTFSDAVTLDLR